MFDRWNKQNNIPNVFPKLLNELSSSSYAEISLIIAG